MSVTRAWICLPLYYGHKSLAADVGVDNSVKTIPSRLRKVAGAKQPTRFERPVKVNQIKNYRCRLSVAETQFLNP